MKIKTSSFAAVAAVLLAFCLVFMAPVVADESGTQIPSDLPQAKVTETGRDTSVNAIDGVSGDEVTETPVTFTMNFAAVDSAEGDSSYDEWNADFELTVNKDVRGVDAYLVGHYEFYCDIIGSCAWVKLGDDTENVLINANTPIKIMSDVMGMKIKYEDVRTFVRDFDCGIYFTPEFINANPDLEVKLALKMYNGEEDTKGTVIGKEYVFNLVAQNGDKYYASLQAAVDAALSEDTITLLNDVTLTETLTIPTDAKITLDLNGCTIGINPNNQEGTSAQVIENMGDLTIKDSGTQGKITSYFANPDAWEDTKLYPTYGVYTVVNQGTLTLTSGTIESTTTGNAAAYPIEAKGGSKTVINGGRVVHTNNDHAIRLHATTGSTVTSLTINGGTVSGDDIGVWIYVPKADSQKAKLEITGGTVGSDGGRKIAIYSGTYGSSLDGIEIDIKGDNTEINGDIVLCRSILDGIVTGSEKITISGGKINGKIVDDSNNHAPFIAGGTFSSDVSAYVAENKICIKENDVFVVKDAPEEAIVPETPDVTTETNAVTGDTTITPSEGTTITKTGHNEATISTNDENAVSIVISNVNIGEVDDDTLSSLLIPQDAEITANYAESDADGEEGTTVTLSLKIQKVNESVPVIDTSINEDILGENQPEHTVLAMITALGDDANENIKTGDYAITIKFKVPASAVTDKNMLRAYHVDNGVPKKLSNPLVSGPDNDGFYTITIYGEHFSSYVLVEEEPEEEEIIHNNGGGKDTGSGNYQYYPREVTADGIIDFGTSKVVTGIELPVGSTGTVTLNTKPTITMPENGFYVFEIDAPGYNTDAKINGGLSFQIPVADLEAEGFTANDIVLFHGTVAEDGKITWEALPTNLVKNENGIAYYKAAINGCSPFYIGFVEDGSIVNTEVVDPVTPPTEEPDVPGEDLPDIPGVQDEPEEPSSPAPILAVLAGLGAAVVLRRK